MPRRSRIDAAGALHHIMVRGIEKGKVFRNDADRGHFLERLGEILQETKTRVLCLGLGSNSPASQDRCVPISTVMRRLLTGYALWFSRSHKRGQRGNPDGLWKPEASCATVR